jgi:hypothetical protein
MLTGTQAKVCWCVLNEANPKTSLCELSASEIAEYAGVPRQKVYRCLQVLAGMGLITYEPGRNQHAPSIVNTAPLVGLLPVEPTFAHLSGCHATGHPKDTDGCHDTGQAEGSAGHDAGQAAPPKGDKQGDKHTPSEQPIPDLKGLEPNTLKEGLETDGAPVGGPEGPTDAPQPGENADLERVRRLRAELKSGKEQKGGEPA